MVRVADIFRQVLDGEIAATEGDQLLASLDPDFTMSNGFAHGDEGWRYLQEGRQA